MNYHRLIATIATLLTVSRGALSAAALEVVVDPGAPSASTRSATPAVTDRLPARAHTLSEALVGARAFHAAHPEEPVTIRLPAGRLELDAPLVLGLEDSRTILRGTPGQKPTLVAGGSRITGWRSARAEPGIWEVTLPEVAAGRWYFNQLFVNGERAQRARTPNTGYFRTAGPLSTGKPTELPFQRGDLDPRWAADPDARVGILMKWTDLHLPLLAVNSERNLARLGGGPRADWMDEPDARYWIENVAEALDVPGEWRLDRKSGLLRYFAPEGIDPNRAEITAPRLTRLLEVAGTAEHPARDIALRDISFAEADYAMPPDGLASPQAAVLIPGSVVAHYAIGCRIEHCAFVGLGGYGLELGRGCQGWTVAHSEFSQLAAGGVRVGEPGDTHPSPADANHSHLITDNAFEHLGRVFPAAVGILVFQSGTNQILHNRISDLYYTGISVGWNWGYADTPCRANEIAYNLVEKIGQGRLSDMGGIYTLGPQPGTRIHHNLFREIQSYAYGGWGLYTDEGSSGITLEENVVYHCKDAGFHQHYGRDNVVRNNLIAFNTDFEVMRTRSEPHRSFWFTNNVVIFDHGALLGSNWEGATNQYWLDGNTYWDTRLGARRDAYRFQKLSWDQWRATGQDPHSRLEDPLLRDPRRPELGLRPESPALKAGFQPIDLRDVGPRPGR